MNENKQLKQKYAQMFDIVRTEINNIDPMGLLKFDACPIDEYDPEVSMIITQLKGSPSADALANRIAAIFSEMFGEKFDDAMFTDCSNNIINKLNRI